ncbi:Uncharacterised protein [uncultured archaeon]|nr:Uncharacterised protein [uncultured archaeon]
MIMEFDIDYTMSAQENAQRYFEKSKEAKKKLEGAEHAIRRLEEKAATLEKSKFISRTMKKKEDRDWYEKFYWFFTSDGMLVIGGRSAQQNEEIVSKYMEAPDMFFHANIFGASATVLKNGKAASKASREEAAQFAACFSKAWESGQSSVDVFAVAKEQLSKSTQTGSLGTGSFLISGEREWFKNVKLELFAFAAETRVSANTGLSEYSYAPALPLESKISEELLTEAKRFAIVPALARASLGTMAGLLLTPGKLKKSEAAKSLSHRLGYANIDYIMQHLPPGEFHLG